MSQYRLGVSWVIVMVLAWVSTHCTKSSSDSSASTGSTDGGPSAAESAAENAAENAAKSAGKALWAALLDVWGMVDHDTASKEKLKASLGVPPTTLSDKDSYGASLDARTKALVEQAAHMHCASVTSFTDVTPGTLAGVSGVTGAYRLDDTGVGVPLGAGITSTVYKLLYKLGDDTKDRAALVVVPDGTPGAASGYPAEAGVYGYPLALYAHAGVGALRYTEVAQMMGGLQANHVIVAPTYPGMALCTEVDTGSHTCTGARLLGEAVGDTSPYEGDALEAVGVVDCLRSALTLANTDTALTGYELRDGTGDGDAEDSALNRAIAGKTLAYNRTLAAALVSQAAAVSDTTLKASLTQLAKMNYTPVTVAFGAGRGAAVSQLGVAYSVGVYSVWADTTEDTAEKRSALAEVGITTSPLFNCAAALAPQTTFTMGRNKLMLDYWVKDTSDYLTQAQIAHGQKASGFDQIYAHIQNLKQVHTTAVTQAEAIAAYLKTIDVTYHTGLINQGLRNWGKVFQAHYMQKVLKNTATSDATLAAATGAGLLLHGTHDKVAHVSNTLAASQVFVTTSKRLSEALAEAVEGTGYGAPGVQWLSLGVVPPAALLKDDTLDDSDDGHVEGPSFLTGTTSGADIDGSEFGHTVTDVSAYESQTPTVALNTWYHNVCTATYDPSLTKAEGSDALWTAFSSAIGMGDHDTSSASALQTSLATAPASLSQSATYAAFVAQRKTELATDAAKMQCASITSVTDITPGTSASAGVTGAFKFHAATGMPTAMAGGLTSTVYLMKYKLTGDASDRGALLVVPDSTPNSVTGRLAETGVYGFPLALYAHASSGGLRYGELAKSMGDLQGTHVIVAPTYPGKPLCSQFDTGKTTCSGDNIVFAAVGDVNPYVGDAYEAMGAVDCLRRSIGNAKISTTDVHYHLTNSVTNATIDAALSAKVLSYHATLATTLAATAAGTSDTVVRATLVAASAANRAPVTVAFGYGRGAAVVQLGISYAAGVYSVIHDTTDATATARAALTSSGITSTPLFNCAVGFAPQESFTLGPNKLALDYWLKDYSDILTSTQLGALTAVPGYGDIQNRIGVLRAQGSTIDEQVTALASYVRSIDAIYHTALLNGGLRNWGRVLRSKYLTSTGQTSSAATTMLAAKGAGLLLHGTYDKVANIGNTLLSASIFVATSASLATALQGGSGAGAPGVQWVSLGVVPPSASLTDGALAATDYGHVGDTSFTGGTTSSEAIQGTVLSSNVATTNYVSLSPAAAMAAWYTGVCAPTFLPTAQ